MATPRYTDEAIVKLTWLQPGLDTAFRHRQIMLSPQNPSVTIGRSSKRDPNLQPKEDNAWFDSPVMSRSHAEVEMDPSRGVLRLRDVDSLHGTFLNSKRLAHSKAEVITSNDTVKLGTAIDRLQSTVQPCLLKVTYEFGSEKRDSSTLQQTSPPVVFRVPDESDMEDAALDEPQIQRALDLTREAEARLTAMQTPENIQEARGGIAGVIDLTSGSEVLEVGDSEEESQANESSVGHACILRPHESLGGTTVEVLSTLQSHHSDPADQAEQTGDKGVEAYATPGEVYNLPAPVDNREDNPTEAQLSLIHDSADQDIAPEIGEWSTERPPSMPASVNSIDASTQSEDQSSAELPTLMTPPASTKKRKAMDISSLLEEEKQQEEDAKEAPVPSAVEIHMADAAPPATAQTPPTSAPASDLPRPAKRLRRVAEVAGIAALGGVAMMSALIATAPAL